MRKLLLVFGLVLATILSAEGSELKSVATELKRGGYAIVFRHVATDDSQKDVFPFRFDDMKAQRQLSDKGREAARAIGASLKELGIPLGEIYTSRLNRAIETGKLISGKEVTPKDALTDSSAGSASGMANPDGGNATAGKAMRDLLTLSPKPVNNVYVTHKTNIADAFGKDYADIGEGEALIIKLSRAAPHITARVKAGDWSVAAR